MLDEWIARFEIATGVHLVRPRPDLEPRHCLLRVRGWFWGSEER